MNGIFRPVILYDQEVQSIMDGSRSILVRPARFFAHRPLTPGILLCVKEAWALSITEGVIYRATYDTPDTVAWRSARSMPVTASRVRLEVTSCSVYRLSELDRSHCDAQGILPSPALPSRMATFICLWNQVFRVRDTWEKDPEVIVAGVRVTELFTGLLHPAVAAGTNNRKKEN